MRLARAHCPAATQRLYHFGCCVTPLELRRDNLAAPRGIKTTAKDSSAKDRQDSQLTKRNDDGKDSRRSAPGRRRAALRPALPVTPARARGRRAVQTMVVDPSHAHDLADERRPRLGLDVPDGCDSRQDLRGRHRRWWCTIQNGVEGLIAGLHDFCTTVLGLRRCSWGLSIILFTAFLRTLIFPLNYISYEATDRNKALKPYMDKIASATPRTSSP